MSGTNGSATHLFGSVDPGPVLLVEDDEATAALEKAALVRHGHAVRIVRDVNTAVELLRQDPFSLALLDYRLVDGVSWPVLEAARDAGVIPVIVVTAMGNEALAAEALKRGATAYVVKRGEYCEHLATLADRVTHLLEVEREHARLAAIVAASDDAIVSENLSGEIVTWNPGAERLFGYTAVEMIGQPFSRLVPDEGVDAAWGRRDHLLRGEGVRHFRAQRLIKDGGRVTVSTSLVPVHEVGSSQVVGVSVVSRDVSSEVVAEESLRLSEERFRRLVDSNVVGVHIASGDGYVVEANENFLGMLGYKKEDLPLAWRTLIPAEKQSDIAAFLEEVYRTGRIPMREMYYQARDGRRIPTLLAVARLDDRQALSVTLDLTERKHLERQLLHSQKMEGIGRLAGGMAHDFNNLLTVINGYSQLIRERVLPDDPVRLEIDEVCGAGERAARLTSQLLAFSRKQVVEPQPLDINVVVTNVSRMLRRLLGEDVDLVVHLAPGLPATLADTGQIEQVLVNLAVNARDAMPQGGKLTLETQAVTLHEAYTQAFVGLLPGPYVRLAVSDTGTGMDAETLARVFEPFFTTKEQGKGTGLGLSTVYGIVKQSEGHLNVYSEPGQGTTFKMYLPVCGPYLDATSGPGPAEEQIRGTETILVVEDDPAIARFLHLMLKQRGYTVLSGSDGEQGLRVAEGYRAPIHLLLTDLVMPRMGGRELAQRVLTTHPETRVMYMSGYADDAVLHHGRLEPGMVFLAKPFAPDVLLRRIRELLASVST